MLTRVAAGKLADLSLGADLSQSDMRAWGAERIVRAAVLRHLLVENQWPVQSKGVRLRGVRVDGPLDLESCTLRCPFECTDCFFDSSSEPIRLDFATASLVALDHCALAGLTGDTFVATKRLDLRRSWVLSGPVCLPGAEIAGPLSLQGARLSGTNPDGASLVAHRVKARSLVLDGGFTAAGALVLKGAEFTSQLNLRGARITASDTQGVALDAERMKTESGYLDEGFTAAGAVRLPDAEITSQLSLRGAKLTAADGDGNALCGDDMKARDVDLSQLSDVAGSISLMGAEVTKLTLSGTSLTHANPRGDAFIAERLRAAVVNLNEGFTASGAVRLSAAEIISQLSLRGARLSAVHPSNASLVAESLKAGGNVLLDENFVAGGSLNLSGASIDGSLSISGELSGTPALQASGLRISHELRWLPRRPVAGEVDLERAQVHRLMDNCSNAGGHWPPPGLLRIEGFTYEGFDNTSPATLANRLDWIRRSHRASPSGRHYFASQPYEQLARVYRQNGQEEEARAVAIARRNDLRSHGSLGPWRKLINWLLDKTIKHGYQPLRAVGLLAAVYILVLLAALAAGQSEGVIVPANDTKDLSPAPTAQHCTGNYPCFYAAGYAVDVVIPLINTQQSDNWRINGDAPWGWAWTAGSWIATGLGWAFSTLAVAAYTGIIKRD
ncbi:hypothetical protein ACWGKK_33510 [Streptomyces chartreusis]